MPLDRRSQFHQLQDDLFGLRRNKHFGATDLLDFELPMFTTRAEADRAGEVPNLGVKINVATRPWLECPPPWEGGHFIDKCSPAPVSVEAAATGTIVSITVPAGCTAFRVHSIGTQAYGTTMDYFGADLDTDIGWSVTVNDVAVDALSDIRFNLGSLQSPCEVWFAANPNDVVAIKATNHNESLAVSCYARLRGWHWQ